MQETLRFGRNDEKQERAPQIWLENGGIGGVLQYLFTLMVNFRHV